MKKIVTTPAGRKRYLEILLKNLIKNKEGFDEWKIFINTTNQEDIDYCKKLASEYDWITTFDSDIPINPKHFGSTICRMFKGLQDPDSVYLRLDDDIVYLEKDFCRKMFEYRIKNPEYFLVFGNIVNNAITDYLHQRFGSLKFNMNIEYKCDGNAWAVGSHTEMANAHVQFIKQLKRDRNCNFMYFQPGWILNNFERCSINAISWFGSEFAKFDGEVHEEEEKWLTEDKTKSLNKKNIIYGEAVCAHFAFWTQRHVMDITDVLVNYDSISNI